MKFLYEYFFVKLLFLMQKTPGRRTADDAALMLLVIALFFYTFPVFFFLIDSIFGRIDFPVLIALVLLYGYGIYRVNKWYFLGLNNLALVVDRYKSESPSKSLIGYALVSIVFFGSFVAFFGLLKLLV